MTDIFSEIEKVRGKVPNIPFLICGGCGLATDVKEMITCQKCHTVMCKGCDKRIGHCWYCEGGPVSGVLR